MKIAFDQNMPALMVKLFQVLAGDKHAIPNHTFAAAKDYEPEHEESDVPWIERFAKDGGQVVISGETKMRGRPHERAALRDASMIVFFFEPRWNNMKMFPKSAMLLNWWPVIDKYLGTSKPPQFWEIPANWNHSDLREVTGPT